MKHFFVNESANTELINESVNDVISSLSPEQVQYLATALVTAVSVGGTITYKAIMEKLKSDKKLKDEVVEKLENVKK